MSNMHVRALSVGFAASSPKGRAKWYVLFVGAFLLAVCFYLALVVTFTLPPLIRQPFGLPPSPEGEGFGAVILVRCRGEPTWSAGACPRPTKSMFLLSKLLSRNEPGAPQRRGFNARVSDSQLTVAARRPGAPQWWRFTTWVADPNCQRPLAAA